MIYNIFCVNRWAAVRNVELEGMHIVPFMTDFKLQMTLRLQGFVDAWIMTLLQKLLILSFILRKFSF